MVRPKDEWRNGLLRRVMNLPEKRKIVEKQNDSERSEKKRKA